MKFKLNEDLLSVLDGPWLKCQVEGHLVWGLFSRYFGFGWIIIFCFAVRGIYLLQSSSTLPHTMLALKNFAFLILSLVFLKMSKYHQAAIGWCMTKFGLAFFCFIMLLVGGLVGLLQQLPVAIHIALLSIVWFPSIEFIPSLQQKQKIITVCRLVTTPIILYFMDQTGTFG